MRKLWLIFAQSVTVGLAVVFVVSTLRPDWLPQRNEGQAVSSAGEPANPADPATGGSYREAAKRALPSVVHVYTTQKLVAPKHPLVDDPIFRHFFGDSPESEDQPNNSGLGSGVIVSTSGYVLTNYHVIEAAEQIEVSLNDGRNLKARLVGSDPETDLAVLQIEAETSEELKLPAISLGQMDDVIVGDVVLAIGNPFGVGQTVTMGIVSALSRSHLGINTFENFIQTDAAINPGNSGGALVDIDGNLVGINSAIYSRSGGSMGIGFAIPVSTAKHVMESIVKNGRVVRGWIGVEPNELTPELAQTFGIQTAQGVIVTGVLNTGPAAAAGMRPGDVITQVDGQPVRTVSELLTRIAALTPGQPAPFTLQRRGDTVQVSVTPAQRPQPQRGQRMPR